MALHQLRLNSALSRESGNLDLNERARRIWILAWMSGRVARGRTLTPEGAIFSAKALLETSAEALLPQTIYAPPVIEGLSALAKGFDVVLCDVWGVLHN